MTHCNEIMVIFFHDSSPLSLWGDYFKLYFLYYNPNGYKNSYRYKKELTILSALYSLVGALLNKVATEIALTCSDIDIYLPSMLKSAVK